MRWFLQKNTQRSFTYVGFGFEFASAGFVVKFQWSTICMTILICWLCIFLPQTFTIHNDLNSHELAFHSILSLGFLRPAWRDPRVLLHKQRPLVHRRRHLTDPTSVQCCFLSCCSMMFHWLRFNTFIIITFFIIILFGRCQELDGEHLPHISPLRAILAVYRADDDEGPDEPV